jgi:hypothetical protein
MNDLSPETLDLVTMAYQSHHDSGHAGSPLDCRDAWCEAAWIDLLDAIRAERFLVAIRQSMEDAA